MSQLITDNVTAFIPYVLDFNAKKKACLPRL